MSDTGLYIDWIPKTLTADEDDENDATVVGEWRQCLSRPSSRITE